MTGVQKENRVRGGSLHGNANGTGKRPCACTADEARSTCHMPTGEADAQQQEGVLQVGDVVERDIDGIWFPAKVTSQQANIRVA